MASAPLKFSEQRRSLLASGARIQVPWIKVVIGEYTFGVFSKSKLNSNINGWYSTYKVQYPNYVQSLEITKINGQVNQYSLSIKYPIKPGDDPNFFEKVFSSVSQTRKIVFTYGDATMPTYVYKDEEAVITSVSQQFDLAGSSITYTVAAVSGAALAGGTGGTDDFWAPKGKVKPSQKIIEILRSSKYKLMSNVFTGMNEENIKQLIDSDDKAVTLDTKLNTSAIDYITYLVSCMIPVGGSLSNRSTDIYVMSIRDDTTYDKAYENNGSASDIQTNGPYFTVKRTSYLSKQNDAFELDIGYNTSTLVTNFSIENQQNYSLLYEYNSKLHPETNVRRLLGDGTWTDEYAPVVTSATDDFSTGIDNITWWTKITKYPINATVTVQGLLRPANLMTYVRLNVIFPGGGKHISSGLYIITKQQDRIDSSGYRTTLNLTKIAGDDDITNLK